MNNATSTQSCIWANGCEAKLFNTGKGGIWRGETIPDWLGQGFMQSEAFTTDGGRPDPFSGIACNTAATSWDPALYDKV